MKEVNRLELYESMWRRKSVRKYEMEPLEAAFLQEMEAAVEGFKRLYEDVPLHHRVVDTVKGRFHVDAPHYLVISGEGKAGEQEAAGFLYQQLVLWLDEKGLGSVWLGASKPEEDGEDMIIVLAFGRAAEPVHRTEAEFKRKALDEVTDMPEELAAKALHTAPSGMNLQPWYVKQQGEGAVLYQQKLKPPVSLLYKLADLDMGIALCHWWLACEKEGRGFAFTRQRGDEVESLRGYRYFGTIRSNIGR